MHFLKYIIAIIFFEFLFWYAIFMVINLPSMTFIHLLTWAREKDITKAKRILVVPISVGIFLFGTLVPALFYSGGIFVTTNYFMLSATHPVVYAIIGGIISFCFISPKFETNILAMLISIVLYILFMTNLKTFGQNIGDIGFTIVDWLLPILILFLIGLAISWLISKFRRQNDNK